MTDMMEAFGEVRRVPADVTSDHAWACHEIDRHIDVTLYYAELATRLAPPTTSADNYGDPLIQEAHSKRLAEIQGQHQQTLSHLYALRERIERGEDAAITAWVEDSVNWWTNGLASPLAEFDPTDY